MKAILKSNTIQDNPTFSIIIATYNRRKTILNAIDSVVNQHYPYYELIIVDDGSTDKTKELVFSKYAPLINEKKLIYLELKKN